MVSRTPFLRLVCLATSLAVLAVLLATHAPAQADDPLVKVSAWCDRTVTFTNLTSETVHISYQSGVPLSPFPNTEGEFILDSREKYTLKAPGGDYYGDPGTTHRLYYEAESEANDQDGYIEQWRNCSGLVKTSVGCRYVKFTNISSDKLKISFRDGSDYFYWDDYFWLDPNKSKTMEFRARTLQFLAEKGADDTYRRQFGTVQMPKKCNDYKDDDQDDDDEKFDPDFTGAFILRFLPMIKAIERDPS